MDIHGNKVMNPSLFSYTKYYVHYNVGDGGVEV